jgi:hypothetical protein
LENLHASVLYLYLLLVMEILLWANIVSSGSFNLFVYFYFFPSAALDSLSLKTFLIGRSPTLHVEKASKLLKYLNLPTSTNSHLPRFPVPETAITKHTPQNILSDPSEVEKQYLRHLQIMNTELLNPQPQGILGEMSKFVLLLLFYCFSIMLSC